MELTYRNFWKTNCITPSSMECLIKLRRNYTDLLQIEQKICSYTFEPNTYVMFLKSESIKKRVKTLIKSNQDLIELIKREEEQKDYMTLKVAKQLEGLSDLYQTLSDYESHIK
ncbi:hypothetical protein SAMN04487911_10957 [Arenibacter nanhaiticus]|uniref:Uncharacterized protein n=1 Tax=Arenibacter nanhaiticus TaxID=558155 RepID=A0A1M6FRG0_9FLAO|nr:hypothetical protein [Arenibacter nanhaiticus]SHJ00256.1 hypothetical protein SAMN04487911_10957 [Arenibacter nanhaiticus]